HALPILVLIVALSNYVLAGEKYFHDYVVAYTNAATIVGEGFQDTEDTGGLFSGFDPETGQYDPSTWAYAEAEGGAFAPDRHHEHGQAASGRAAGDTHGSGGPPLETAEVERDETLTHPRSVFQIVKRSEEHTSELQS